MMDRDVVEEALRRPAPDEPVSLRPLAWDGPAVTRVRGTTGPGGLGWHTRVAPVLVVLATTLAIALTWQLAAVGETTPPVPQLTAMPSATATVEPSRSGLGPEPRFHGHELSFSYPETWQLHRTDAVSTMGSNIAVLGTTDLTDCRMGPLVDLNCAQLTTLEPGGVLLFVDTESALGGSIVDFEPSGGFQEFIDGMPAVVETSGPWEVTELDERRKWRIGRPGVLGPWYSFTAALRGPGLVELRQQVDAVVRSLRFDEPIARLSTDPATVAAVLRRGIDAVDRRARESSNSRMYACFPRTPDSSSRATIEDGPDGPLAVPLEVTCSVAIEPTVVGLWDASLSVRWEAGPGYAAGRYEERWYLDADGDLAAGQTFQSVPFPGARPDLTSESPPSP